MGGLFPVVRRRRALARQERGELERVLVGVPVEGDADERDGETARQERLGTDPRDLAGGVQELAERTLEARGDAVSAPHGGPRALERGAHDDDRAVRTEMRARAAAREKTSLLSL